MFFFFSKCRLNLYGKNHDTHIDVFDKPLDAYCRCGNRLGEFVGAVATKAERRNVAEFDGFSGTRDGGISNAIVRRGDGKWPRLAWMSDGSYEWVSGGWSITGLYLGLAGTRREMRSAWCAGRGNRRAGRGVRETRWTNRKKRKQNAIRRRRRKRRTSRFADGTNDETIVKRKTKKTTFKRAVTGAGSPIGHGGGRQGTELRAAAPRENVARWRRRRKRRYQPRGAPPLGRRSFRSVVGHTMPGGAFDRRYQRDEMVVTHDWSSPVGRW